jgi:hypothetical protein
MRVLRTKSGHVVGWIQAKERTGVHRFDRERNAWVPLPEVPWGFKGLRGVEGDSVLMVSRDGRQYRWFGVGTQGGTE